MINLNLLPQEYSVKTGLGAITRVVRGMTLALLVMFLTFAVGMLAFFLISSLDLKQTADSVESLKVRIRSLETTEQRLVLLKDRLAKIKIAQSQSSSKKSLADIKPVLETAPASIENVDIGPKRTDVSVNFSTFGFLDDFLKNLYTLEAFKSIIMTSFGFSPLSGYLIDLGYENKP